MNLWNKLIIHQTGTHGEKMSTVMMTIPVKTAGNLVGPKDTQNYTLTISYQNLRVEPIQNQTK